MFEYPAVPPAGVSAVWMIGERLAGDSDHEAIVYRATSRTSGLPVVVKFLNTTAPEHVARFRQEADVQSRIVHQNILRIIDFDLAAAPPYIVTEYGSLGDLRSYLRARPGLPQRARAVLLRRIASGVQFLHTNGYVHRDLKPDNIVMAADDLPKLMDFGLARCGAQVNERITSSKSAMGTPGYESPEQQVALRTATAASDVFSLGILFYFVLTGTDRLPTVRRTLTLADGRRMGEFLIERYAEIRFDDPLLAHVPPSFVDLMRRMTETQPDRRPRTAEVVAAFARAF
jgi:serine/threonine protein kinase